MAINRIALCLAQCSLSFDRLSCRTGSAPGPPLAELVEALILPSTGSADGIIVGWIKRPFATICQHKLSPTPRVRFTQRDYASYSLVFGRFSDFDKLS